MQRHPAASTPLNRFVAALTALLLALSLAVLPGCSTSAPTSATTEQVAITAEEAPSYAGEPATEVNGGVPAFTEEELQANPGTEEYAPLDDEGRCGQAFAVVGEETMPEGKRGSIGQVKPTGWHLVKYSNVDGGYLYNRCHLIGWQLAGENANERNLITGTRYLNVEGMLPYEDEVADYIDKTRNHVLYRVTPVFEGSDEVALGVQMEALSVEDNGRGVCFNVFCHNVQPGVSIDYATGDSAQQKTSAPKSQAAKTASYVINTKSGKFHKPECESVKDIAQTNRKEYSGKRQDLINRGYTPCKRCNP